MIMLDSKGWHCKTQRKLSSFFSFHRSNFVIVIGYGKMSTVDRWRFLTCSRPVEWAEDFGLASASTLPERARNAPSEWAQNCSYHRTILMDVSIIKGFIRPGFEGHDEWGGEGGLGEGAIFLKYSLWKNRY